MTIQTTGSEIDAAFSYTATQAQLLRGLVTLYSKQLQYLFDDAQNCVAKLQSALSNASDTAKHTLDPRKLSAKCDCIAMLRMHQRIMSLAGAG
jgi:hypothetical protein